MIANLRLVFPADVRVKAGKCYLGLLLHFISPRVATCVCI